MKIKFKNIFNVLSLIIYFYAGLLMTGKISRLLLLIFICLFFSSTGIQRETFNLLVTSAIEMAVVYRLVAV